MGTVILISTVAIIVAIVGCAVIWRLDARAPTRSSTRPRRRRARDSGAQAPAPGPPDHVAPRPADRRAEPTHPHGCRSRPPAWQVRRVTTRSRTDLTGGTTMGLDDKIGNKAEELKGKAKEATGKATDNEQLEAEGKGDQAGANVKQAGEKIKDAFKS